VTIAFIITSAFLGRFLLNFNSDVILVKYIAAFLYGSSTWSYFPVFPWISYPLLGIIMFKFKNKIYCNFLRKPIFKISIGVLFIIYLFFTLTYAISVSSNLNAYYHHGLTFFLWTAIFLAFYRFIVFEIDNLLGKSLIFKYIKWLGQNATAIYVIQWILIGNIATVIYKSIDNPFILLAAFIGILLFSSIISFLYLQIKKGKKFAD
jgi:uncharacterized membrane protein